jgi:7-keto-8-aminopelargonate synthetase-like enzyme
MSGTELWLLVDTHSAMLFTDSPHGLGLIAHHGNEVLGLQLPSQIEHVRNQRATG